MAGNTLEEADRVFHRELLYSANMEAPLTSIKVRERHAPGLSQETRNLLTAKREARLTLERHGTPQLLQDLKALGTMTRAAIRRD